MMTAAQVTTNTSVEFYCLLQKWVLHRAKRAAHIIEVLVRIAEIQPVAEVFPDDN